MLQISTSSSVRHRRLPRNRPHLPLMANILNFGGYSGTAGEATQATTAGTGTGVFVVADHGRVHTYIASDGFYRGTPMNPELIFDPTTGAVSPGGMQLIIHEIGHALGLKHTHDDGADGTPDLTRHQYFPSGSSGGRSQQCRAAKQPECHRQLDHVIRQCDDDAGRAY